MSAEPKDIPGFDGYAVTRDGRVWSKPRNGSGCSLHGKWLKPQLKNHGYFKVTLGKKGNRYSVYIHFLVLETFVGARPVGMECRHLDGNPRNNRLSNLKWGTRSENIHDTIRHGKHKIPHYVGTRNPAAKLLEQDVRMIVYMWRTGLFTRQEIANTYSVSYPTIRDITTRRTWGHLWLK